jgi:hypothetical protein
MPRVVHELERSRRVFEAEDTIDERVQLVLCKERVHRLEVVLTDLLKNTSLPVRLRVLTSNPARHLFAWLGFKMVGDMSLVMGYRRSVD